jgi:hypothetical protein
MPIPAASALTSSIPYKVVKVVSSKQGTIMYLLALSIARLEFEALLVSCDGAIKIFETVQCCSFATVAFGPLGIQRHASVSIGGGFFKETLAGVARRAIGVPERRKMVESSTITRMSLHVNSRVCAQKYQ